MIRVLLVDDHPVIRQGLRAMLDPVPDIVVAAEAGGGDEALARLRTGDIDVALVDLMMPGVTGWQLTAAICASPHHVPVLILTTYDGDGDILRAIEAGATGYLLKDAPVDVLADALRAASRGEMVLAPTVAARLAGYHRRQAEPTVNLSARELQVLLAVADGLTNAGIGLRLHIGESTVKTHLARVFAKLEVDDRTAAVTRAHELGLIRISGPNR
jgi:DNA-binding NarL/FixJ family response regulator